MKILPVLLITSVLIVSGCTAQPTQQEAQKQQFQVQTNLSLPKDVVQLYFEAWNIKNWSGMYAVMSDGFKNIEPSAKTQEDFARFAESQGMEGVKIINLELLSADNETASVNYAVEFMLKDGGKKKFESGFTLRFRQNDAVPGWKMIHPYGNNVDTS